MTAAASTSTPPFVLRQLPRVLVLGSFFVVALPLAAYVLAYSKGTPTLDSVFEMPIAQAYVVLFGVTHFFLTFSVYLSSPNVRHFTSSPRNMFAFLVAPIVPLVGLAIWYGSDLSDRFLASSLVLFTLIRGFDFYHLSRQAFGVLQLFKMRGLKVPAWTRSAENIYFLALAALMYFTFLGDKRFDARSPLVWCVIAVTAGLFIAVVVGYVIALRAGSDRKQVLLALAYFGVQTGSCLLAVYRTGLYAASLAVHYVEYHVLMAPRVFKGPVGDRDRTLGLARRWPIAFYATLLLLSGLWWFFRRSEAYTGTGGTRALVHVFDGIFVFHYVIEMSIWKFSDPYLRKSLGPLYG